MVKKNKPAERETVESSVDSVERQKVEKALISSEERYRSILEQMQDSYYEVDLAGNFTFVSDSFCGNLDYAMEELVGNNFRLITADKAIEPVFRAFNHVYKTGESNKGFTNEVIRKDGSVKYYESSIALQKNKQGETIGFCCVGRDITERRKLEESVISSEERYRTILEQMHDSYYEFDLAGNFIFANQSAGNSFGYSREEMLGQNYRLTVPEEDIKSIFAAYNEVYRTGKPNKGFPHRIRHKDGSIIFSEVSIALNKNRAGEIVGFKTVSRDITERKQAEEALARSEERYRTILENMQDSYIEVDLAGNFTFINEATCRNLGYTMEELIGQSFGKIAPDQDGIGDIFKVYNGVYETGEPHTGFAFKVMRKDGSIGYAETSISLIKNEQGRPIGFRSVGRDVTERKQMEQKLEEMATHDALTGLPNRTLFYDRCGIALANAQRNKKMLVIMTLDLDFFKDINDTLGHDMGDRLLITAAVRLTGALRKSDTVARVGGDEFVLLLGEVEHKNDAVIVAEKILKDFRQPFLIDGHSLKVTVSIGIAIYPENGENMGELLKCSDKLLYTAKQNGRDRFAI